MPGPMFRIAQGSDTPRHRPQLNDFAADLSKGNALVVLLVPTADGGAEVVVAAAVRSHDSDDEATAFRLAKKVPSCWRRKVFLVDEEVVDL